MPKGVPNKKDSGVCKQQVIETVRGEAWKQLSGLDCGTSGYRTTKEAAQRGRG